MTADYVDRLVRKYPSIGSVWLFGSRANGTTGPTSDWDYLIFADIEVLAALRGDEAFRVPKIDLMVVFNGNEFEKPWPDGDCVKRGSLDEWNWRPDPTGARARYRATKAISGEDFKVKVTEQIAQRIWPP